VGGAVAVLRLDFHGPIRLGGLSAAVVRGADVRVRSKNVECALTGKNCAA